MAQGSGGGDAPGSGAPPPDSFVQSPGFTVFDDSIAEPVEDIDEPPETRPVSIDDRARLMLLAASLLIFVGTIGAGFLTIWFGGDTKWTRAKELIGVVLPVETLVIGGAATYYFKTRSDQ